jgi:hypothetical protein
MHKKYARGTIGNEAPFHSHRMKNATHKKPQNRGARTPALSQGKETPPFISA